MELSIRPSVESHLSVGDISQTAAHEFGHVLGLKHCLRCDSVMNYENRAPKITDLDVRTFRRLVAIPNGAHVVGRPASDAGSVPGSVAKAAPAERMRPACRILIPHAGPLVVDYVPGLRRREIR